MSYLLDSSVLLWLVGNNKKLGKHTRQLLASTDSSHFAASVVSLWEVTIKTSLGKLQLDMDLERLLRDQHISILSVLPKHIRRLRSLPLIHRDPFDRLLISQSLSEDLILITGDRSILRYDEVRLLDART